MAYKRVEVTNANIPYPSNRAKGKHVPTPGAFGKCKYPKFLLRLKAIEGIKKRKGDIKAPKRLIP